MKSNIAIINSNFINITSNGRKNIINAINSKITIQNSNLKPLKSPNINVVMIFLNCELSIKATSFYNYTKGLIHSIQGSIKILNSILSNQGNINLYKNSNSDVFSTIQCEFCSMNVFNSTFQSNINEINDGGVFLFFLLLFKI